MVIQMAVATTGNSPSNIPPLQPQLAHQVAYQTLPLESPFAWKTDSYFLNKQIKFYPEGTDPTISFYTERKSKILGYIPIIGTIIGATRIYNGIQEFQLFKNTHLHSLSNRSILWIARGCLETIPVLGGIACMVIDLIATKLANPSTNPTKFEDETDCGHCHRCGYCKC